MPALIERRVRDTTHKGRYRMAESGPVAICRKSYSVYGRRRAAIKREIGHSPLKPASSEGCYEWIGYGLPARRLSSRIRTSQG